ncbi:MAG: HNH endonuclease [Bdellovibrio sp. CG12_big_fil_rev_8_21_14_0_65_39_13]|nr:MAG: HNH endonuclease [Bdellovibrio sp. CG12_big_fil_rev_8_21_14_0_65_39_13]
MKFLILICAMASAGDYNRRAFKHWIDSDHDCQNTRQEVLIARSKVSVTFTKKKNCTVADGKWADFYFNEELTNAGDVDIDHVVPLKHAWLTGAENWTKMKRTEFANDMDNLVITNKKYNRQKGAKTVLEWMPINRNYACKYFERWFLVKNKYQLSISDEERKNYSLLKCDQQ